MVLRPAAQQVLLAALLTKLSCTLAATLRRRGAAHICRATAPPFTAGLRKHWGADYLLPSVLYVAQGGTDRKGNNSPAEMSARTAVWSSSLCQQQEGLLRVLKPSTLDWTEGRLPLAAVFCSDKAPHFRKLRLVQAHSAMAGVAEELPPVKQSRPPLPEQVRASVLARKGQPQLVASRLFTDMLPTGGYRRAACSAVPAADLLPRA